MNKEIILPSGAKLHITLSPFAISKALYLAVLEEARTLHIDTQRPADFNFFKDVFCAGFSSRKIEQALNECMKRVLYNGTRITDDTFEPVEAREDYTTVCFEVAQENLNPFTKHLLQQFNRIVEMLGISLQSKP